MAGRCGSAVGPGVAMGSIVMVLFNFWYRAVVQGIHCRHHRQERSPGIIQQLSGAIIGPFILVCGGIRVPSTPGSHTARGLHVPRFRQGATPCNPRNWRRLQSQEHGACDKNPKINNFLLANLATLKG